MNASVTQRQIGITIPTVVYVRLGTMAKTAGMSTTAYATTLLMAAYTARCKETGDRDLDAAVARVVLLHGAQQLDTDSIARMTGLHEQTVVDIIQAWKRETRAAA